MSSSKERWQRVIIFLVLLHPKYLLVINVTQKNKNEKHPVDYEEQPEIPSPEQRF